MSAPLGFDAVFAMDPIIKGFNKVAIFEKRPPSYMD